MAPATSFSSGGAGFTDQETRPSGGTLGPRDAGVKRGATDHACRRWISERYIPYVPTVSREVGRSSHSSPREQASWGGIASTNRSAKQGLKRYMAKKIGSKRNMRPGRSHSFAYHNAGNPNKRPSHGAHVTPNCVPILRSGDPFSCFLVSGSGFRVLGFCCFSISRPLPDFCFLLDPCFYSILDSRSLRLYSTFCSYSCSPPLLDPRPLLSTRSPIFYSTSPSLLDPRSSTPALHLYSILDPRLLRYSSSLPLVLNSTPVLTDHVIRDPAPRGGRQCHGRLAAARGRCATLAAESPGERLDSSGRGGAPVRYRRNRRQRPLAEVAR